MVAVLSGLLALGLELPAGAQTDFGRQVFNILPPGQSGAFPPNANSTDQLRPFDALTPLFGSVRAADIPRHFKSARFGRRGQGRLERTPRRGLEIRRDRFGVPHIFGRTRADVMFGAGWVTAQDRGLFIEALRRPARLAALDAPGINSFDVAASLRRFDPSAQTEAFIRSQEQVLRRFGGKGRQVLRDVDAYIAGINAHLRSTGSQNARWTRTDVGAFISLIGARFGRGGGDEVRSARFLAALQGRLGEAEGRGAWGELTGTPDDPETFATAPGRFPYHLAPSGAAPGALVPDAKSVSPSALRAAAADQSWRAPASNALLLGRERSATGRPLAVMGPQVQFFYPEIFLELDLHGGEIDARGVSVPGIGPYVLIGRGRDFGWSATTSDSDNTDQFLEELCNPDGSPPTTDSNHYRFRGRCRSMTTFDAGTLSGAEGRPDERIVFRETVHGPVSGTATVDGRPYAISSRRSTRGREGASALAFSDLNANRVRSARDWAPVMNQVEFNFNWFYLDDRDIAYFTSGRLPLRARGTHPKLPTDGSGRYEWRGFLPRRGHAQAVNPRGGLLLNWNNKPAPGWGAPDDKEKYNSVHRVELLNRFGRRRYALHDVVSVMNQAATQDLRVVQVWPVIEALLATGAPDDRTARARDLVSAWRRSGGSRLDRDLDGSIDDPGAAVLDAAWPRIAEAVMRPVLGDLVADLAELHRGPPPDEGRRHQGVDDTPNPGGSAYDSGFYGYVDKDLRRLLGQRVRAPYGRAYCGGGDVEACRGSVWAALSAAADELAAAQGPDPSAWRADARPERIVFRPGLLGEANTMRWANRPTFQQLLEFRGHRPRR